MTIPLFTAQQSFLSDQHTRPNHLVTDYSDAISIQPALPCIYGRWCGPGCSGPGAPINDVDDCCRQHDFCYDRKGYFSCSCNRDLLNCLRPKINIFTAKGRWAGVIYGVFSRIPCNPLT